MDSIPPQSKLTKTLNESIRTIAKEVAFKERLPWELQRLRESGSRCVVKAKQEILSESKSLGAPPEQVAGQYICRATVTAAQRLKASASGKRSLPTEEQMEDAVKVFGTEHDAERWKVLIKDFNRREAESLQSFVEAKYESLKGKIETKTLRAILTASTLRSVELWLEESR